MKNKLYLLSGIVLSAVVLAFIPTEDEKIQIHLLHHENGMSTSYDTIFDPATGYTVEDFITDKGLNPDNTHILDMNVVIDDFMDGHPEVDGQISTRSVHKMEFKTVHGEEDATWNHKGDGNKQMYMTHKVTEENGETQDVTIQKKVDADGNVTIEKTVNGEIVEIDPAELDVFQGNKIIVMDENGNHKTVDIEIDSDESSFVFETEGEEIDIEAIIQKATEGMNVDMADAEVVMINKTVDDEGNVTIEKRVNGELVEAEEADADDNHFVIKGEDGAHRVVKIKKSKGGDEDVQMFIDIEADDIQFDSDDIQIHTIIKEIDENGDVTVTETTGEKDVDVKVFRTAPNGEASEQGQVKVMAYSYGVSTDNEEPIFLNSENGEHGAHTIAIVTRVSGDSESASSSQYQVTSDNAKLPIENLNFFPNPNDGNLRLNFFLPQRGKTVISVYDIEGKRVFKSNLGNFQGAYDKELDLTDLETGTYILRITQNNLSLAEKLIVN